MEKKSIAYFHWFHCFVMLPAVELVSTVYILFPVVAANDHSCILKNFEVTIIRNTLVFNILIPVTRKRTPSFHKLSYMNSSNVIFTQTTQMILRLFNNKSDQQIYNGFSLFDMHVVANTRLVSIRARCSLQSLFCSLEPRLRICE